MSAHPASGAASVAVPLPQPTEQTSNAPYTPNMLSSILAESSHPTALLFHFAFRTAALLVYLFGGWVAGPSFMFIFALCVILLSIDFWQVKNVSGRYLVGRRWWSGTVADGSTVWRFEARPGEGWKPNAVDARLFWGSLYGFSGIWIFLGLVAILRFNPSWLLVVIFALMMNLINLFAYLKCDREARSQMINNLGGTFMGGYVSNKLNSFFQS